MFNATVTTTVYNPQEKLDLHDTVVFLGVDETFIGSLANSCKTAVMKLLRAPQTEGNGYTIHYQTTVTLAETGSEVEKRPPITCGKLSREQVYAFLKFAIDELSQINDMRYGDVSTT